MKKARLLWFGFIVLASVASAADTHAPIVVVISVDGLPADYFDHPNVALPNLRRMAREGVRAERMQSVFPTVTWPNHTSMVTGVLPARHGVVANRHFDRATRTSIDLLWDPKLDKEDLVLAPTVYDVAHRAGLKTAGIAWPGSRNAKYLDWQVPCVIDAALIARHTTPSLLAEVKQLGLALEKKPEWGKIEGGGKQLWDWLHTRIAQHVLQTHRPNLLLLHLDGVDALEHRNGRNSPESYWAANIADHYIGELLDTAQSAGLGDRVTFFIVSDHGFRNYRKQINLNAMLRQMGLIKTAGNRVVESRATLVSSSGSAGLYIHDEADREVLSRELISRLRSLEGVEAVLGAEEIIAEGLPAPGASSRGPDIVAAAAEGYAFSSSIAAQEMIVPTATEKGAHGHLPNGRGMHGTFIAWGSAIKPAVPLSRVHVIDLAPTIAVILGVPLPEVDGRVLREILR